MDVYSVITYYLWNREEVEAYLDLLRGLLRWLPGLDVAVAQEVGLAGASDPDILEWAAHEGRVLLTQDANPIPDFAYARVAEGFPMPGVVVVPQTMAIGQAIEELILLVECSSVYLPLRLIVNPPHGSAEDHPRGN